MKHYNINYMEKLICLVSEMTAAYKSCAALSLHISPSGYLFRISSKDFIK